MTNLTVAAPDTDAKREEQKAKLLAKFPELKEEDLQYEEGKRDEMLNRIQVKFGKTREEMEAAVSGL
jgi:hypothetical protein